MSVICNTAAFTSLPKQKINLFRKGLYFHMEHIANYMKINSPNIVLCRPAITRKVLVYQWDYSCPIQTPEYSDSLLDEINIKDLQAAFLVEEKPSSVIKKRLILNPKKKYQKPNVGRLLKNKGYKRKLFDKRMC